MFFLFQSQNFEYNKIWKKGEIKEKKIQNKIDRKNRTSSTTKFYFEEHYEDFFIQTIE